MPQNSIVTEGRRNGERERERNDGISGDHRERAQGQRRGSHTGRGFRRSGQRGRGRGDGFGSLPLRTTLTSSIATAPSASPGIDPGGSPGKVPAQAASSNTPNDGIREPDVEAEVCFICASPVVHNAVSTCNHRTCHICALRLRALYKTRACPHCRVSLPQVGIQSRD